MPKREIGLMGYVGEAVVHQWLEQRFPPPEYEIVSQIMPVGVPKQGGPYLDLAVARQGIIGGLYEVKSQDVIWESPVNLALQYIWANRDSTLSYITQDGREFNGSPDSRAHLVLLGAPNKNGIKHIGEQNIADVILFEEIMDDLDATLDTDQVLSQMAEDLLRVVSILRNPTAGRRIKLEFLKRRQSVLPPSSQ